MCTVTWTFTDDGYHLFFNRDELRTRGRAEPPQALRVNRVRCIAPIDTDSGGSWIVTNEYGITFGLTNYYTGEFNPYGTRTDTEHPENAWSGAGPNGPANDGVPSRGPLLLSLGKAATVQDGLEILRDAPIHRYRPFTVFGIEATGLVRAVRLHRPGDRRLEPIKLERPLIASSGFKPGEVIPRREEIYDRFAASGIDPGTLLAYHKSTHPSGGAYSVCMERPDAITRSLCWVTVDAEGVQYRYTDGPPCRTALAEPVIMSRSC